MKCVHFISAAPAIETNRPLKTAANINTPNTEHALEADPAPQTGSNRVRFHRRSTHPHREYTEHRFLAIATSTALSLGTSSHSFENKHALILV